jgi:hypothetical protein
MFYLMFFFLKWVVLTTPVWIPLSIIFSSFSLFKCSVPRLIRTKIPFCFHREAMFRRSKGILTPLDPPIYHNPQFGNYPACRNTIRVQTTLEYPAPYLPRPIYIDILSRKEYNSYMIKRDSSLSLV